MEHMGYSRLMVTTLLLVAILGMGCVMVVRSCFHGTTRGPVVIDRFALMLLLVEFKSEAFKVYCLVLPDKATFWAQ